MCPQINKTTSRASRSETLTDVNKIKLDLGDHKLSGDLLDAACLLCELPAPLGQLESPASLLEYFSPQASAPITRSEQVRVAIRDLLRAGGFRPSGRNKPASEYLIKAVEKGFLSPTQGINAVVDACNVVSLHSGLPMSVVDLAKTSGELSIGVAPEGTSYPFNPSGQTIDISGLLALRDEAGWCANAVKDAQRTKTDDETTTTLTVIWGTCALPERTDLAMSWYKVLLEEMLGVTTRLVSLA